MNSLHFDLVLALVVFAFTASIFFYMIRIIVISQNFTSQQQYDHLVPSWLKKLFGALKQARYIIWIFTIALLIQLAMQVYGVLQLIEIIYRN